MELLSLHNRTGGTRALLNPNEPPITIAAGTVLCGFGKIQFRQLGSDGSGPFDADQDIAFAPKDSSCPVPFVVLN